MLSCVTKFIKNYNIMKLSTTNYEQIFEGYAYVLGYRNFSFCEVF